VTDGHGNRFTILTDLSEHEAVIAVRGALDPPAMAQLRALFEMVVATDIPSVAVDLGELDMLTPECLALVADAAEQLATRDRQIVVRSPSARVRRLLDGGGLKDLIAAESGLTSGLTSGHLDTTHGPGAQIHSTFASGNDVVDEALRMVVALARVAVIPADGVSVSLRRHEHLATVAASDPTILDMDTYQYATGEGPCVDASVEGRRFHAQSLSDELRWPAFTPRARSLGIRSILSEPLFAVQEPVGALNIYSHRPDVFADEDEKLASMFATETSALLTSVKANEDGEERGARIQAALETREKISQAQGVIMERQGISADDAYTALRVDAQALGHSLRDHAKGVVTSSLQPYRDGGSGPRDRHD
jgi:anti-anti-sigma factor